MSKAKVQMVIDGKNDTKKAFNEVDSSLTKLGDGAKKAGAALLAAFSVGSIASWVRESARAMANMERMAQLSGAGAEQFSAWAFASKTVGIEQEKLGDIFKDVQDKIGDFLQTGGGGLADFFENIAPRVGVTAEQFRNLSGPDALQLYVSSLEKANLSQSEMTFYMEAIANDATLLVPLLASNAQGFKELAAQAEKLGLVMSGEDAANAKAFEQSIQTLGATSEGAGRQVSAELLPTLNALSGLLQDTGERGAYASQIASVLGFSLKALATVAILAGNAIGNMGRFIGAAAAAASLAARGQFSQAADVIRMVAEDNIRETKLATDKVTGLWDGSLEAQGKAANETSAQWAAAQGAMVQSSKAAAKEIKDAYSDIAKEAKKRINEVKAAESKANSELERIRAQRLEIEQRYAKAYAQLAGAGTGEASYAGAQDLQLSAKQALAAKDFGGAQKQAAAALQMLLDIQAAGGNTYGLQGFAQELEAIEREATRLAESDADAKLQTITARLEDLQSKADIKITADLSPEEMAKVTQQIQALADALGKQFIIRPTIAMPAAPGVAMQTPEGYATGGLIRGPGTGTSDSIPALLSNGEYVIRAAAVRKLGTSFLDLVNQGMPVQRFADGGLADSVANLSTRSEPSKGIVNLTIPGGESFSLEASGDQFDRILKQTARKFGRTRP